MTTVPIITALLALLLAGCIYEAPLVAEHTVPIEPELVGVWQMVPKNGANSKPGERLLILKLSETEYLVRNPHNEDGLYFRAYPIKLGGKSCVQMEVIGTKDGAPDWGDHKPSPFMVASFELAEDNLVIRILNRKLVSEDLKTTATLQETFLKHKDSEELFADPAEYRRVVERGGD
ncbi:MAG: hypothetical protein ABJQ29_14140 [Luteolibacter sp.]